MTDDRIQNNILRAESGGRSSDDPFVSLFYSLLRDHVPPSTLETLVRDIARHKYETTEFTNGWLADYAKNLVQRLRECEKPYVP